MVQGNSINAGSAGYQVFDGVSVFSGRTFQAGTGISLTNASGVAGNTTITATGGFTPNSAVMISDDFVGTYIVNSTELDSEQCWAHSLISNNFVLDNAHPGNVSNTATNNGQTFSLYMAFDANVATAIQPQFILGGGVLTINWVFNVAILSDGTNTYTLKIGMLSANNQNGFYFAYSNGLNSGNWTINTIQANTPTTTNTATAVTTGWHNAQMVVNAAASSISFSIDGVSLGSIATTIPTVKITPAFTATCSAGTVAANTFYADLMYLVQTLTTAR